MEKTKAKSLGLDILATFRGFTSIGVDPQIMGIGPVAAVNKLMKKNKMSLKDIDLIELNEAFAAQAMAVMGQLELDPLKVNPWGGAIALGHPLGATGAIRTATLMSAMRQGKVRYGMISMCIGTGMGAAGVFERI